jgi:hypothetical protein
MATMDVYGFTHEDLLAARSAVEEALSIRLEEAEESDGSEYFRVEVPSGPCVQICSNSGTFLRWGGEPREPWHPAYRILVFLHGPAQDSVAARLRGVIGLSFLEKKETM